MRKLELKKAVVCIIGLGYIGLPIAEAFSRSMKVIGFDIDSDKIGELTKSIKNSNLLFTDNDNEITKADFIIVCVPTPVTRAKEVDLSFVENAARIAGRNMKKGSTVILESTVYPGVTEDVERILRAAAKAHRATGVPISTHTHPASEVGLSQQDVFESEGVDLSRVVIGHSGDTEDTGYLRQLCDRGSYVGMDRFGIDVYLPGEKRVSTIAKMCELGYAEKMVLSHDASCYFGWVDPPLREKRVPNWHFNHIPDDVIPALLKAGVTEDQVTTMTVDNPRRIFERQGAY